MYHRQRWTSEKIKQQLELLAPLVYVKRKSIPSFFYRELESALAPAPIGTDVDDSKWQEINAHEYWGSWLWKEIGLQSLISISSPHVIIETIKRAEDGQGLIVRLYESQRKRGPVQLHAEFALAAAWETDLLEENGSALRLENDSVHLDLKPYQIMTLRLKPQ